MSRGRSLKEHDLPVTMAGGGAVVNVSGGGGGSTNADTVDGYHAAAVPMAGRLLALDAAARFPASVIDWTSVAGVGLQESPADKLAVKLDINSGLSVSASGLKLSFAGGSPTTIEPDDSAAGGSQPYAARADHRHAIAAAAPSTNLSVTSANAEGNATSFARSNHTHAINTSSNPGANAAILASSASGYLQLVRLGLGVAPSYPLQVQGAAPQLRLQQDASNYADFEVAGDGDLTIQPSGDSLLVPSGKTLASSNWVSQTTGWGIYPDSVHGRDGYADFRYIYADELHVKAFIADLEQALAGGQIISKSVAILAADFTIPAKGASATLVVEDLPGTTAYVFANGDWVRIRNISRSGGGLVVADAYGTVTQVSQNGDGTQTYTFTRAAADTGSAVAGTVIQKGGLVLDYGVSGNGYWEVTTLDPAGSPYAQVATWKTHPQNLTVHARLGNLDGIAGIGAEWGLWAGKDSNHWIKVSDAGAEIKGLKQTWIDAGGNTRGQVDPTAIGSNYLFWLGPSSSDKRFGVTADGTVYIGNVPSQNVAGWAHASDLTKIDGGDIYAGSITAEKGTFTTFNLVDNPGFEFPNSGWTLQPGASFQTDNPRSGSRELRYNPPSNGEANVAWSNYIPVRAGQTYYAEVYCHASGGAVRTMGMRLQAFDKAKNYLRRYQSTLVTQAGGGYNKRSALITLDNDVAFLRVELYVGPDTTTGTAHYWDDVVLREATGMNVLVGVPGGARVEINSAGIEGRDSSNVRQFRIRTEDGVGAFGPSGKESLISEGGLRLWGGETVWTDYSAVRWLANPEVMTAGRIASIGAGLYDDGTAPSLELIVNPRVDYPTSSLSLLARSSPSDRYVVMGMRANPTWGGTLTMSGVHGATLAWSMHADSDGFKFIVGDLQRAAITTAGMRVTGNLGIGTNNPAQLLHVYRPAAADATLALQNTSRHWIVYALGAGSFAIRDHTSGNNVVSIAAGAPTNSINIASNGNVSLAGYLYIGGQQVVRNRYINSYLNNEPQSTWSSASWDLLRAIRDCLLHHGLAAAS